MQIDKNCICFPESEPPNFGSDEEKDAALRIHCPIHGVRFNPATPTIYKAAWLRECEQESGYLRHSEQYRKALMATEKGSK